MTPEDDPQVMRNRLLSQLPSDYRPMLDQYTNALARSTPAEALDVPTLARAAKEWADREGEWLDDPEAWAAEVAEIYARLRSPESDEAR